MSATSESSRAISGPINVKSAIPKQRQQLLKWNGWGYNDSKFVFEDKQGVYFSGQRYSIGELSLPHLISWVTENLGVDLDHPQLSQPPPKDTDYPPPNISQTILDQIKSWNIDYSVSTIDRLVRAHGQTMQDIYILRKGKFERIPDVVVWPKCHQDVVNLVNLADENDLVIIPFGGGTAVSGAVECPSKESRPIISLDTSQMNRILWLDEENLVACCESGIIGQDLERELTSLGYTTGHEPDSYEFSSLGGWVATRASGMKKNVYGNIEDLLVHVKMVTPKGVLEKNCQVPRMSCGPDFNHVIMGSEGSLGVVTEVVLKIRPLPKCKKYGSIVFPDFESGMKCMREVAKQRCQPASIRLMDNGQFKFGLILKPAPSYFGLILDGLKQIYLTAIKGFDLNKICVMTLLFEGDEQGVKLNEQKIYEIGQSYGGVPAGEKNGERGYMLTFVIAYLRDLAIEYSVSAESFETSVPWDRAVRLIRNVKYVVETECIKLGITHYMINSRVTQTYDAGCVIYFYLGFNFFHLPEDPVQVHHMLEEKARDEIIACGGSISHHHGVGKLRRKWYKSTVSEVGAELYRSVKNELDPNNVFATNNLISLIPKSKL
ncbi:LOW QUALITY PROTEIN: alkyldihydroxyacetonephosphate synthase [Anthonomus grandis grandis]|uniref:LOW QUALITY PROTEIN: alkyldihydroxyacetonephosphate synthase n=1 Tax=Anthonomus grandis grandis TaxID=2921223 RepID=UPI00216545C4|nr:LOW QUALITY PROTEIN: alkyldihydroxyacetonephosphate synthase [Anthonomus grandis grandis]